MSEEQKRWEYKVGDIFEEIPDDPENVLMNIPEEIRNEIGLVPGDVVRVLVGDQGSLIIEKVEKENSGEEKQTED